MIWTHVFGWLGSKKPLASALLTNSSGRLTNSMNLTLSPKIEYRCGMEKYMWPDDIPKLLLDLLNEVTLGMRLELISFR
jgi:hypothetical protein